jgi:hypothetical protein
MLTKLQYPYVVFTYLFTLEFIEIMKQKTDAILNEMIVFCKRNTRRSRLVSFWNADEVKYKNTYPLERRNLLGRNSSLNSLSILIMYLLNLQLVTIITSLRGKERCIHGQFGAQENWTTHCAWAATRKV